MRVSTMAIVLALLCLAACKPATSPDAAMPPASEQSTDATAPLAGDTDADASPSTVADVAPAEATAAVVAPTPDASADDFEGWYYEKAGVALLQACGQAVPLNVADPSFLRQLNGKAGGGSAPVYVRLRVRLADGAKLDVAEVRQFGVDEGPAPRCARVAGS